MLALIVAGCLIPWYIGAREQEALDAELLIDMHIATAAEGEALLNRGADPNARDSANEGAGDAGRMWRWWWHHGRSRYLNHGTTALGLAVRSHYALELTRLLLDRGANPNAHSDEFPLFWAARDGNFELTQLLLDRGADPNYVDSVGFTPLMGAIMAGNAELVKLLLQRGATLRGRDLFGKTPEVYARQSGNRKIIELLQEARRGSGARH